MILCVMFGNIFPSMQPFVCVQPHLYAECRLILARHSFILRLAYRICIYFSLGILYDIFGFGGMDICDMPILISFASSHYYYHRATLIWCPCVA